MTAQREEDVKLLSIMVRGAYDLQMLRMQSGIRLAANFRAKLFNEPSEASNPTPTSAPDNLSNPDQHSDDEADEKEAKKIIEQLRASYRNLMAGVARNRTLPDERGFKGDALISTFTELALVDNYMQLEKQEGKQFGLLESQLNMFPIWTEYLGGIKSVGPATGGMIISRFNPARARHVSSFWKFAGLDVGPDGRGRSRRAEHLVERAYTDKNGRAALRNSITYDPWVKTKLMGVVAGNFVRQASQPWRQIYDDYKHRLMTDPAREKVTLGEWKKRNNKNEEVSHLWPPGRIDTAAKRYMIKMFLQELWITWRRMEGLPVTEPYSVAKQGRRPHAA